MFPLDKVQQHIIANVRQFVEREVAPVASQLEHRDEYPHDLVAGLRELGLFGCNVPEEYGGLALSYTTFALIIEELARGWMSLVGPIGTHSVSCDIINRFGTDEQRRAFLPGLASGERRGGLALSEADAAPTCNGCARRPRA
jgi:alkylation response protein AidB-like acyl-CoA dehydrogenase